MKTIYIILGLLFTLYIQGQDTIVFTSLSDYKTKLQLYKDSLDSYNIGKSVCIELMFMFNKIAIESKGGNVGEDYIGIKHNNDLYFLSGWEYDLHDGQVIDSESLATFTMFSGPPDLSDGFAEMKAIYKRLDSCKVYPYGYIGAGEAPTIYIYRKPTPISYKAPCFSTSKEHIYVDDRRRYTVLDKTTKFLLKADGKTKIPYIIRYYFHGTKLDSLEMVDPIRYSIIQY